MKTMGEMIQTKRKELGMTQLEVAARMNVTDKAVSKWERDLSFPDVSSLPRLAEVLGVSVEELVSLKQSEPKSGQVREIVNLVMRAVGLAMGVAVVVMNLLGELDTSTGFTLLGIGLFTLGVWSLGGKER